MARRIWCLTRLEAIVTIQHVMKLVMMLKRMTASFMADFPMISI